MSTCSTPTPDTTSPDRTDRATQTRPGRTPQTRRPSLTGIDRTSQAETIRATLDEAAAGINAFHAQVLSTVIAMKEQHLHRSAFGFSALRDLLLSQFDFTFNTAGSIAAIARLSSKFRILTQAAVSGQARIDQVAYAVRQLDQTPAMRLFARTPFRTPVASPFDPAVECATPEAMVAQYCAHASFNDLKRHLEELWAAISEETELLDALGEQSLQRLELTETGNGMWHLEADLTATTGRLLDKYLKTACPPPRQDEADTDGVLPPQANRHAEALHQLLAGYGTSPEAATRHGHTATLDLTVDIATLRGEDTGRLPLLEGKPISLAQARLLACETRALPAVFDYQTGEAVELGRTLRLPNVALRRKLELEQPGGCAWHECSRPIAWTEAHHIVHWADGGPTTAENLILVCRFHHGRLHTEGWSVEKTGPGTATITHHDHQTTSTGAEAHGPNGNGNGPQECGCADWRTDADMDAEHEGADWDVFPTGLYRSEWSEMLKPDLDGHAEMVERHRARTAIREARAKARTRFTTEKAKQTPTTAPIPPGTETPSPREPALAAAVEPVDYGEPPFLPRPSRRLLGDARPGKAAPPDSLRGPGPPTCPHAESHHTSPHQHPTASSPPALTAGHRHPEAEASAPCTTAPLSPPALTPTLATGHPQAPPRRPPHRCRPQDPYPAGPDRPGVDRTSFLAARPNPKRQRPGDRSIGLRAQF